MKTIKSVLAVALFFISISSIKATEAYVYIMKDNTFILSVGKLSSDINIRLMDKNGYDFYKKFVKKDKDMFQKRFDIKALPDGEYQIEIEDGLKVINLSMKIENNKILSKEVAKEKMYKPTIYSQGAKLFINQFADNKKPIKVMVYNDRNFLVHEETLHGEMSKGRVYEFKQTGDYTVSLLSNEKVYTHSVTVERASNSYQQIVLLNK